jgi:cobalamin biosynthesis protein CobC
MCPSAFDSFALPAHGGDLAAAEMRFGRPAGGWLDLSTGVNPFAYPLPPIPEAVWQRLPDSELEASCRAAAAQAYGVADPELIASAPGSQAIIQLLPRLRPPSRVAVVGPTYGEHATSWSRCGHQVSTCESLEGIGDAEVVVVCNPNNPDGQRSARGRLLELAGDLASRGGWLVVDEAFCDMTPELSLAGQVGPGIVILRSFGKFFGLPGVRLGFAIAEAPLVRLLQGALGPWAVSGPALLIGLAALSDGQWMADTRQQLVEESAALDGLLAAARLSVIGGTTLFRLVNAPRAWALYEHLAQRGVLVRPFVTAARWLRLGLPPGKVGRQRLKGVLASWTE